MKRSEYIATVKSALKDACEFADFFQELPERDNVMFRGLGEGEIDGVMKAAGAKIDRGDDDTEYINPNRVPVGKMGVWELAQYMGIFATAADVERMQAAIEKRGLSDCTAEQIDGCAWMECLKEVTQ